MDKEILSLLVVEHNHNKQCCSSTCLYSFTFYSNLDDDDEKKSYIKCLASDETKCDIIFEDKITTQVYGIRSYTRKYVEIR